MTDLRDVLPDAAPPPGARERIRSGVPARVGRQERRQARRGYVVVVATAAVAVALFAALAPATVRIERVAGPAVVMPVVRPVELPRNLPAAAPLSPGLLTLPSGARVVVRAGAEVALVRDDTAATELRLGTGTLLAHVEKRAPGRPFVVAAGPARVEVVGTIFVVERSNTGVTVSALEGTVRVVPAAGAPALVHAGEVWPASATLAKPSAEEAAQLQIGRRVTPATAPMAPVDSDAGFAAARAREEAFDYVAALVAYRAVADGTSAEAEDALYAFGRLQLERQHDAAAAAATWAEYRRRFPAGRYARAVDLQQLEAAIAAQDWPRVRAEADAFLAAHADDARAARFRLGRAAALAQAGKCTEALEDLRASGAGGRLAARVRDRCHVPANAP